MLYNHHLIFFHQLSLGVDSVIIFVLSVRLQAPTGQLLSHPGLLRLQEEVGCEPAEFSC